MASSLLLSKQMDLLASAVVPSLQKETLTVETESDSSDLQMLNKDTYFFSNFATATLMEMLANGAEGQTQETLLAHFLGKPIDEVNEIFPLTVEFFTETGFAGGPKIKVATRSWVQRSMALKSEVDNAIKNVYMADVCYLAFFSPKFKFTHDLTGEVDGWVKHRTRELIRDSFGSVTVDPETRLLFTASLDFAGEWNEPFDDAGVREFTLPSGDVVKAPFMTSKRKQYVQQFKNFKVLSIPYKQHEPSRFSMLFYLPDALGDYKDLQYEIGMFEEVIMGMQLPTEQVEVSDFLIPKFRIKMRGIQPFEASDFLTEEMVSNTSDAGSLLGIHKFVYNSYLEINEKGTTAAGVATAFIQEVVKDSAPVEEVSSFILVQPKSKKARFEANRPFLFFIRDNKFGRMLFSGGLTDPIGTSFT